VPRLKVGAQLDLLSEASIRIISAVGRLAKANEVPTAWN
jgi:hypothetical protein